MSAPYTGKEEREEREWGDWEVPRKACSRREQREAIGFAAGFWEELSILVKI